MNEQRINELRARVTRERSERQQELISWNLAALGKTGFDSEWGERSLTRLRHYPRFQFKRIARAAGLRTA